MRGFMVMIAALGLFLATASTRADEPKPKTVAVDDLPDAVVDAAKAKFPQGEIKTAAQNEENGQKLYALTVKTGDNEETIKITPKGEILAKPAEAAAVSSTSEYRNQPRQRRGLFQRLRERRLARR
jgi:hypothetical protein